MNVELRAAAQEEKETLRNLLEKYNYEFSQYDLIPFDEEGLFGYRYLDNYWTEEGRRAYFIRAEDKLAGFVLLNQHPECQRPVDWAVAEFFVAYPYRRAGVGTAAMEQIFAQYKGHWQIKYHQKNTASKVFWHRAAEKAASGTVEVVEGDEPYDDGSPAQVLCFHVA